MEVAEVTGRLEVKEVRETKTDLFTVENVDSVNGLTKKKADSSRKELVVWK